MRANPRTFPDVKLYDWPQSRPNNWIELVNSPETREERSALRRSVQKGAPFGEESWRIETAKRLNLESSLRNPGRPLKR